MAKHKPHRKKNKKGTKKGDTIHGRKKGTKGEAAAYITRAQALAKLQVPLADFRRLCILKGIYPRDPKKKPSGLDKTYYHMKDIIYLSHEPLLNKFFELKTFMKKFKRLMGRNERELAGSLEDRKPIYTLHHLVRERFPAFDDAMRDMDDAVSMLALFQALSADQRREIPADAVNEGTRLYQEFQLYVIRSQTLRKVFASIKGYYFQAVIRNQTVTWLAPHQFAQNLPAEVDFKVMLTFCEFYRAMTKFVNFRLYADLGLSYPPKRDSKRESASADVAALEVEMREAGEAREAQAQRDVTEEASVAATLAEDFGDNAEAAALKQQAAEANRMKFVFRGMHVFINREVPLRPVYFTLLCGGATAVGWERGATVGGTAGAGSAFSVGNKKITHQIIDRPADQFERRPGREYVQPQWVFDSFNTGVQLPIAPYAPGRAPPPHLSPFVDDRAEGYVPQQREILDRFASEAVGTVSSGAGGDDAAAAGAAPQSAQASFENFSQELKAESSGVWHSDFREGNGKKVVEAADKVAKKSKSADKPSGSDSEAEEAPAEPAPKPTEDEEDLLRRKALMPKKHKRLLQRIEKGEQKKKDSNANLMNKRRQLAGAKKED